MIIELPPWVLVLYPSALFLHFNIDVHGKHFLFIENCGINLTIPFFKTSSSSLLRMEVSPRHKTPALLLLMETSVVEGA